jgi:flagellar motor switch protein FliM
MDAQLSQDEIDRLFREYGNVGDEQGPSRPAVAYDFRRPDRIPKEQLRAIHLMHDFLARNLASSLGAYLRAYVTVSLVSVEQLSFGEFLQYLPTPTCISNIGISPTEGNAVLDINPSLVFPMLDILLGGSGAANQQDARELTEIEISILEGVIRLVLHDLTEAWAPVGDIRFSIEGTETQPQLMQILSPNEAIVAIGFEMTMGDTRGIMNFGVPSILVKMMGQGFEQQWSIRRRASSEADQARMQRIVMRLPFDLEARIRGSRMRLGDLLRVRVGDVVSLDVPVHRPADLSVEGVKKYEAEVIVSGNQRGVVVGRSCEQGN